MDVLVAKVLALGLVEPPRQNGDRSPESLAILLARAAERVRTDPDANIAHYAVRGAADVLRARIDERIPVAPGAGDHAPGPARGRERIGESRRGVDNAD